MNETQILCISDLFSDEGLTFETSALNLKGGQLVFLTQLIKPNYLVVSPTVSFKNYPLYTSDLKQCLQNKSYMDNFDIYSCKPRSKQHLFRLKLQQCITKSVWFHVLPTQSENGKQQRGLLTPQCKVVKKGINMHVNREKSLMNQKKIKFL